MIHGYTWFWHVLADCLLVFNCKLSQKAGLWPVVPMFNLPFTCAHVQSSRLRPVNAREEAGPWRAVGGLRHGERHGLLEGWKELGTERGWEPFEKKPKVFNVFRFFLIWVLQIGQTIWRQKRKHVLRVADVVPFGFRKAPTNIEQNIPCSGEEQLGSWLGWEWLHSSLGEQKLWPKEDCYWPLTEMNWLRIFEHDITMS